MFITNFGSDRVTVMIRGVQQESNECHQVNDEEEDDRAVHHHPATSKTEDT